MTSPQERKPGGLAPENTAFIGERQPGLSDAVPTILEKLDPVLAKLTATLGSLQKTADNLTLITKEGSDLPKALAEFKRFGTNLNELSGPDSSVRRSLANIEKMTGDEGKLGAVLDHISVLTGPESDFAKALANAEKFTSDLANNGEVNAALRSMRQATQNMDRQVSRLGGELHSAAGNLTQATDTVKRQPWRLIWPTTKKYPEESSTPGPLATRKNPAPVSTAPATPAPKPLFRSRRTDE